MTRDSLHQAVFLIDMLLGSVDKKRHICPACGSAKKVTIARKRFILKLNRCDNCSLMYRTPIDRASETSNFYQKMYFEGTTTEMPMTEELENLKKTNFVSMEKDFGRWIKILKTFSTSGKLLDYGCSWGYGAWQFTQAGYDATGFEISRPRGEYAIKKLGVDVTFHDSDLMDKTYDIVFSSHVIEHVQNPLEMVRTVKRILKPGGIFLGLTPNGSSNYKHNDLEGWMSAWGRKHPIFLDELYFQNILADKPHLITSDLTVEKTRKWFSNPKSCVADLSKQELVVLFINNS